MVAAAHRFARLVLGHERREVREVLRKPVVFARRNPRQRRDGLERGHGRVDGGLPVEWIATPRGLEVAVLDAERVEKTILIGHSMGGIVAMATALAHPERIAGLVLIGSTSQCAEKVAGWYERIARAGEREGLEGLARAIYGERSERRISGDAQGIAHVTRTLKSLNTDALTPKLGAVDCAVLLLVGEKDPMGPRASEIIRDALPEGRARFELVPGRGHWLHVEAPDVVMDAVDRWQSELS